MGNLALLVLLIGLSGWWLYSLVSHAEERRAAVESAQEHSYGYPYEMIDE
jgi:hypothetical protein